MLSQFVQITQYKDENVWNSLPFILYGGKICLTVMENINYKCLKMLCRIFAFEKAGVGSLGYYVMSNYVYTGHLVVLG